MRAAGGRYQPLEAFAKECPAPVVSWDRQSPADFEGRPVTELAWRYDVMIIDHPGLGAAIAAGAIQPLRRLVPRDVEDEWKATSFVPAWDSYVVGGQPWALPVDAATQVSVFRPDLLPGAPGSWAEVPALARERRVALCLGGPHASSRCWACARRARRCGSVWSAGCTHRIRWWRRRDHWL